MSQDFDPAPPSTTPPTPPPATPPTPTPPGPAPYDAPAPPVPAAVPAAAEVPEIPWRRLDRRMLLVHPINEALKFLPVLVGIVLVGRAAGGWQLFGLAVPVVWGLWRFFTTSFRITETQVELKRGLLSQTVLTARLDRVRTVELTSSLIHRALGLSRVRIGTGSSAATDEGDFELDALTTAEAERLRGQLLRVAPATHEEDGTAAAPQEETLLELDPRWARYAPFTSSSAVAAAGLLALGGQLVDALSPDVSDLPALRSLDDVPLLPVLVVAVVLVGVLGALLGVVGYLVSNWDFELTRRTDGTSLRVCCMLLTTTETTLETARVRGVTLVEPLGLRGIGAARTRAMVVGASRTSGGTTTVAPHCPRDVAATTADRVLGSTVPLHAPLHHHGPAATRRRYTRAVAPVLVLAVAAPLADVLGWLPGWVPGSLTWVPLAVLPFMLLIARDRARRLGHALTEQHLVVRDGTLSGRHVALDLDGVIGWQVTQTFFQRRVGLATLVATTAAGAQHYDAYDVPVEIAVGLAHRADPQLVGQFLA